MVYHANGMVLRTVRNVFTGGDNDVFICRDMAAPGELFYTLVYIKDLECAKAVLSVFENGRRDTDARPYTDCFADGNALCYLFPYRPERRLSRFGPSQIHTIPEWERVCVDLVMACLASPLPFPLLALALEQDNAHITRDGSVYLSAYFDLSRLKTGHGEPECARRCIRVMLAQLPPAWGRVISARLLRRKLERNAYRGLPELYRDIRITARPPAGVTIPERLRYWFGRVKDRLFFIFAVFCAGAALLALVIGVSQLLFGEVPLFRLFENAFEMIGTRRLS